MTSTNQVDVAAEIERFCFLMLKLF
jgi:hypothetical protein